MNSNLNYKATYKLYIWKYNSNKDFFKNSNNCKTFTITKFMCAILQTCNKAIEIIISFFKYNILEKN
jgi:hypothetical protein